MGITTSRGACRNLLWLLASLLVAATVVAGLALIRNEGETAAASSQVDTDLCDGTRRMLDLAHAEPVGGNDRSRVPLSETLPEVTRAPSTRFPDIIWDSPQAVSAGREQAATWVSTLEAADFRTGMFRQWHADNGGLLQMEVMRFGSHRDALNFQDWVIGTSCGNATDLFTVSSPPQAVGLQLIWAHGDRSDQVSFVVGSDRYLAAVVTSGPPPREMILSLTEDLASWTVKEDSALQQ